MKLKFVQLNQESRGGDEEPAMKKEEVETAKEDLLAVREPSPPIASNPLLVSVGFSLLPMCELTFGWV